MWIKTKRHLKMVSYVLIFALILSMLGSDSSEAASKKTRLNAKKVTLSVGKTKRLKLLNKPKKGKVSFKSSNKKVATVSKSGKVKAKKKGYAKITCYLKVKKNNKTKTKKYICKITVKKKSKKKNIKKTAVPANKTDTVATPSTQPNIIPTVQPSAAPTSIPTVNPSAAPTTAPTAVPSAVPTANPSAAPTTVPTAIPSAVPTANPSAAPTTVPTAIPSAAPTANPSAVPTIAPTAQPSSEPTESPATTHVPLPPGTGDEVIKLDFEDGTNSYFTGRKGTEVLTVEAGGYNDNYALKVSGRTLNWHGARVDVKANLEDYTTYQVEAYVKQTSGGNRTINATWDITTLNGERSYDILQGVTTTTGNWTKIDATIVAPGDTRELYLYFEMENYTNDFYVDNITVTKKTMDRDSVLAVSSLKEAFADTYNMGCSAYTYHLKNPDVRDFIKHHYDTITYGDEMKPDIMLLQSASQAATDGMPVINKAKIDECMTLARDNDLKVRVHTIIWYNQTPDWFFCENYTPEYDDSGNTEKENIINLVDRDTMLQRVNSYVTQMVTYIETNYPGVAYAYDVVNEVINDSGKLRTLSDGGSLYGAIFNQETSLAEGDNGYITEAFKAAKEAAQACSSTVPMYYNDYKGLTSGTRKAVVNVLADAKAAGYIDGIGMQCHQTNLAVSDGDNIKNSLNYYGQNGYAVNITELDFKSTDNSEEGNATLASAYKKFFEIINNCKNSLSVNISNVTLWGLTDLDSWLTEFYGTTCYPLLFDGDYMPKAAFYAVLETAPNYINPSPLPTASASPTASPTVAPTASPTAAPTAAPTSSPDTPSGPAITISLAEVSGPVKITSTGYSIGDGAETAHEGTYIIDGNSTSTSNYITVSSGTHFITLKNVIISGTTEAAVGLASGTDVTLNLEGTNNLTSGANHAGIEVPSGAVVRVQGETGFLQVTGGTNGAGIGASSNGSKTNSLGTIYINSGTIYAVGQRNCAGIGDSLVGTGGKIYINGGNIFGKSSGNGAAIGEGGSIAADTTGVQVVINGGSISGAGSVAVVGVGRGTSSLTTVTTYGGSISDSGTGKPLIYESSWTNKDSYYAYTLNLKSESAITDIEEIYIDGIAQNISEFVLKEGGTGYRNYTFNFYLETGNAHVIKVVYDGGQEKEYSVS